MGAFDAADRPVFSGTDGRFYVDSMAVEVGVDLDCVFPEHGLCRCDMVFRTVLEHLEAVGGAAAEGRKGRRHAVSPQPLRPGNADIDAVLVDAVADGHRNGIHRSAEFFLCPGDGQRHRSGLGTSERGFDFSPKEFLDGEHVFPSNAIPE
ncbi:hypothetical protein SDC9_51661 [bioreactor metagenome]|uniref:Uncharacterized protein n=1 Tax=bioreactor metagenome TaxID=1076179 RepID=A0A644WPD7_9ZZZZ